jgi:NAD(P)-dependent dehydrogenase (short-subunit alcohol dehydrogenase family)|tara:strand:+ start:351 stop:1133 length:783 start_codon:yes stop_codon:yes gene_type:complete
VDLNLSGKTALITGASKGIGEHLAETFAAEGVHLHLTARSMDRLEALKDRLAKISDVSVTLHPLDLTADGAVEKLSATIKHIDILVNNAGAIPSGDLWDVNKENWRNGWDLKVYGYIDMCREFYTKMKNAGGGVIINNIGNGGEVLDPKYIAGASGNASLMGFTRALGAFSLDDNIRVVGVNPGPVDTDRIYNMLKKRALKDLGDESHAGDLQKGYPLGRPANKGEVSDIIVFLASHRAGYITGTIITVDGGIASRRSII